MLVFFSVVVMLNTLYIPVKSMLEQRHLKQVWKKRSETYRYEQCNELYRSDIVRVFAPIYRIDSYFRKMITRSVDNLVIYTSDTSCVVCIDELLLYFMSAYFSARHAQVLNGDNVINLYSTDGSASRYMTGMQEPGSRQSGIQQAQKLFPDIEELYPEYKARRIFQYLPIIVATRINTTMNLQQYPAGDSYA